MHQPGNFHFDGQYRGNDIPLNTNIPNREKFLEQVQSQRKLRKSEKLRTHAVVKIQAWWRSVLARRSQTDNWRTEFDEAVAKVGTSDLKIAEFEYLIRRFILFVDVRKDVSRLLFLCQHALKLYKETLLIESWYLRWARTLVSCVRYIKIVAANTTINITIPLRFVEVCMDSRLVNGNDNLRAMVKIIKYALRIEFFESLRLLLEKRVPNDLIRSHRPPTPLAESLLYCIIRPLALCASDSDLLLRQCICCRFCQTFLTSKYSNQVQNYLLPAISQSETFPLLPFITSIVEVTADNSAISSPMLSSNANLFYGCLVLLSARNYESLVGMAPTIITLLERLSPTLIPLATGNNSPVSLMTTGDYDDKTTSTSYMEVDMSPDQKLVDDCVTMINSDVISQVLLGGSVTANEKNVDIETARGLCRVCHVLFTVQRSPLLQCRMLYSLSFKPWFLRSLWMSVCSYSVPSFSGKPKMLLEQLQYGLPLNPSERSSLVPQLSVFCSLFTNMLMAVHDAELDPNSTSSLVPFNRDELCKLSSRLRDVALGLVRLALPDTKPTLSREYRDALSDFVDNTDEQETEEWNRLFEAVVHLLSFLHERDVRLKFCPEGHWINMNIVSLVDQKLLMKSKVRRNTQLFGVFRALSKQELEDEGPPLSAQELRSVTILKKMPFVVPFVERVKIMQELVRYNRGSRWGDDYFGPRIGLHVRRNYLYEDAFEKLSPENEPDLRKSIRVSLSNWQGLDEAGIDGGGVFREFLSELLKTAFDPSRGFFSATPHERLLYPNPLAPILFPDDYHKHYYFLGRMVGKLLYEGLLAELPFASFFLSKLMSKHSSDVDIHHLASLDPVLYNGLLSLKLQDIDVDALELDFSVIVEELGEVKKIDLKPNGRDIRVTCSNRIEYIHLMADFYLNRQIRVQTSYFRDGLSDLIDLDWLSMFDYREFQILLSGVNQKIDVDNMRSYTVYSGGYNDSHVTIVLFWKIARTFTDDQLNKLLKFVTSCSRPPLLGFKDLYPPFNIQCVPEFDRLPTASTCMNLLKLPNIEQEKLLKEKLLYAIESGTGFELS